jgi:hypothetical protein
LAGDRSCTEDDLQRRDSSLFAAMTFAPAGGLHLKDDPSRRGVVMLSESRAFSGFAVDDLERARAFYGDTLGLKTSEENGLLTLHLAGGRDTLVYPKPDHAPANFTILNFPVGDIEGAVDELTARGVRFER